MADGQRDERSAHITRFRDTWWNVLRITTIRVIVQAVTFTMFVSFVLLTTFANIDRLPGLRLWVGKMLEIDPLVALATAISTHTVYKGLLWSLVILIPTFFLGRFFCNWICPFGSLHHCIGWMFNGRTPEQAVEANRHGRIQHVKYFILIAMLVAALFGCLQIGLLDPICLLYRSMTGAILPAMSMPARELLGDHRLHQGAWLIGSLVFGFVAMNLLVPRFFCRAICPLGALLGLLSRFAWWRIERDTTRCTSCGSCLTHCEGACDPHSRLRLSECLVCFNCLEDCPEGALRFAFMPSRQHEIAGPDLPRRKAIFAGLTGLLFFPFVRTTGASTRDFSSKLIRPPGSVEEIEFLGRCIKCNQCVRVCPTNVIQPTLLEAGLEGLWTPVLDFQIGHCQYNCTACAHVCPTGAIQRISIDRKLGLGEYARQGPIRLGTAHFDTGRCLPYSKNIPCLVCQEVCPTSPKAIHTVREMRTVRNGTFTTIECTDNTVTVRELPRAGQAGGTPARFIPNRWSGDGLTNYFASVQHADGMRESRRITGNDADTLTIEGDFARHPQPGTPVTLQMELRIPKIDTNLCIGCGLCERKCPVVGDRRAVYVTADGETRSRGHVDPDRDRSLRLIDAPSG